jgi:hypothetical protein
VLSSSFTRALSSSHSHGSNNSLTRLPLDAPADAGVAEKSMILGRVICYRPDTGEYDILDVDDSKKYVLPERQVVVLDLQESQRKLTKGELVFALYPDTTSFYPAVVSHAPRRTAMGAEPSVIVQFSGDEDSSGECSCIFGGIGFEYDGVSVRSHSCRFSIATPTRRCMSIILTVSTPRILY